MSSPPGARRARILEWLRESQTLTIEDLVERLGVSTMTVHRDLNWLADAHRVVKVHGGAMLPAERPAAAKTGLCCAMCDMSVRARTAFKIRLGDGRTLNACCPHCGLLLMREQTTATSALTRDFLYGRMTNAIQAVYLLELNVSLCCVPSVLCFASEDDARRFQSGFGGRAMSFEAAVEFLSEHHGSHHHD